MKTKKTYTYWVYARAEVEIEATPEQHQMINAAIGDESINARTHPDVHRIFEGNYANELEPDMTDLMELSNK